ncbi:MAG: hypothetical protein OXH51_08390 [Gemmatimonadetes bacterium]|nr:hypothetical protein [Gemmatimonadota bacterium]
MRQKTPFLLATAVMLLACNDITPSDTQSSSSTFGESENGISTVAAAIAHSMADESVRLSLLKAMRASVGVEHRLMLADYLRMEESESFLRESANALGMSGPDFIVQVEALGEIEIVIPIREHRLSWTGTPRVGVAGMWDSDLTELVVYDPTGASRRIDVSEAPAGYDALFLVRPMETIGTRIGRQADVPGPVVQDPDDGEVAVIWTLKLGDEEARSVDFGSFDSEEALRDSLRVHFGALATAFALGGCADSSSYACDASGGGGGGGGSKGKVTNSATTLDAFALNVSTEIGTEEVEITVEYTNKDGTRIKGKNRYEGVVPFKGTKAGDEMLPVSPARGGATFKVSAVETDLLFDDDLGWDTFNYKSGPGSYTLDRIVVDLSW